jgi:Recombination endonuclease VII
LRTHGQKREPSELRWSPKKLSWRTRLAEEGSDPAMAFALQILEFYLVKDRLFSIQNGRCVICQRAFDDIGDSFAVTGFVRDHDHKTGLLRGLLCSTCNLREDDSPEWVAYRAHSPADRLGIGPVPYKGRLSAEAIGRLIELPDWHRRHIGGLLADAGIRRPRSRKQN